MRLCARSPQPERPSGYHALSDAEKGAVWQAYATATAEHYDRARLAAQHEAGAADSQAWADEYDRGHGYGLSGAIWHTDRSGEGSGPAFEAGYAKGQSWGSGKYYTEPEAAAEREAG